MDQTLTIGDDPPEARSWIMRPDGRWRYTASLSDASGEAEIAVANSMLRIRYLLASPEIRMEQWLYLSPDGQSAVNLATVRFLGIPIARLSDRVRRESPQ